MNYNKYEALLGSVTKAEMFANRMNACVEAVRSKGTVCRRDLLAQIPNPNYYLDLLERFGVVKSEIHAEEAIDIKFDEYYYTRRSAEITTNPDGTLTITDNRWSRKADPRVTIVKEPHIEVNKTYTHITGYQTVQVKRKYWVWKV